MKSRRESLAEAEQEALKVLGTSVEPYCDLTERAFNTISEVLYAAPECKLEDMSLSRKVATCLLIRISNDLRSASLLALRGYPIQAAALVAGIYEITFTLLDVGGDDEGAERWINHDDPTKFPKKIYQLTKDAVLGLRVDNAERVIETQYRDYQALCMAKHGNPFFQKQFGLKREGETLFGVNGPDTSELAVCLSWYALEKAVGLSMTAARYFSAHHVPGARQEASFALISEVDKRLAELRSIARSRWGGESTGDRRP